MPALQMMQAIAARAHKVSSKNAFRVFLAYNVIVVTVFAVVWYKTGLGNCALPKDQSKPTWPLAFHVATQVHVGFGLPAEFEPRNNRARGILTTQSVLSWMGLLVWAGTWT